MSPAEGPPVDLDAATTATAAVPAGDSPAIATAGSDQARTEAPTTGRLVRSSVAVATGTALSRLTGLVRVGVLAAVLGGGALADAFNLAYNTPHIVYELVVGGVLSATLVPLFVESAEHDDDDGPSAVLSVSVLALLALTAVAAVIAPLIVALYAVRLPAEAASAQRGLAVLLLYLFLPQMIGYGLAALFTAMLNARRRFLAAAYAPVVNNLVVIAGLIVFANVADELSIPAVRNDAELVLLLGGGATAGVAAMAAVLWRPVRSSGWQLRWSPDWHHPAVKRLVRLSGWTVAYVAANQVTLFVVLALANTGAGAVTSYTYAFIFFQLPHGLIAVSIMTTFVPELASAATRRDWRSYRERFGIGSLLLVGLLLPASVGYALLSRGILNVLLRRGEFGVGDVELTSEVMAWFAVGLVGFSLYLFALRGFYALQDTRTPFYINTVECGLNIVFAAVLVDRWGVQGLAAAFSFAYIVAMVIALGVLRRRVGGIGGRKLVAGAARMVVAAGAMTAVLALTLPDDAGGQRWAVLAWAIPLGACVYVAVLALLYGSASVRVARRVLRLA